MNMEYNSNMPNEQEENLLFQQVKERLLALCEKKTGAEYQRYKVLLEKAVSFDDLIPKPKG